MTGPESQGDEQPVDSPLGRQDDPTTEKETTMNSQFLLNSRLQATILPNHPDPANHKHLNCIIRSSLCLAFPVAMASMLWCVSSQVHKTGPAPTSMVPWDTDPFHGNFFLSEGSLRFAWRRALNDSVAGCILHSYTGWLGKKKGDRQKWPMETTISDADAPNHRTDRGQKHGRHCQPIPVQVCIKNRTRYLEGNPAASYRRVTATLPNPSRWDDSHEFHCPCG